MHATAKAFAALGFAALALLAPAESRAQVPAPAAASHPNGLKLELLSATAVGRAVAVRLQAQTGDKALRLNRRGRELVLTSENGDFTLVAPAGDPEIHVPAQSRLDASLLFTDVLRTSPEPGPVTLTTNATTGDAQAPRTAIPKVSVALAPEIDRDLPLPKASRLFVEPLAGGPSVGELKKGLGALEVDGGTLVRLAADSLFEEGKTALKGDASGALRQVAELIQRLKPKAITIVAHTDAKGEAAAQQDLSERQAKSLADWLEGEGKSDPQRTTMAGSGATSPLGREANADGSDNADNRRKNRRIEIVLQ